MTVQKIRNFLIAIGIVIGLIVLVWYTYPIILPNGTGFNGYTKESTTTEATVTPQPHGQPQKVTKTEETQPGKTLWDWMQLLLVPVMLAFGGFWLNRVANRNQEKATQVRDKIAVENQHELALQAYIDKISESLKEGGLRGSKPEEEVQKIARARTLTVLQQLDGKRKRSVLQFLKESGLIDKGNKYNINLDEANLKDAELRDIILKGVDLKGAYLYSADLRDAKLNEANLQDAKLNEANLCNADLSGADLQGADLQGAKYNTKKTPKKNSQGKPVIKQGKPDMIDPTQWPQGFDDTKKKMEGLICIDCQKGIRRIIHMVRSFWGRFWTRKTALGVLIAIFLLAAICTAIGVFEIWGKAWSNVATIGVAVLTAVTAIIAYIGIPLSPRQEARRKMQQVINQYVDLQSRSAEPSQKNREINRMRELAPDVRYSRKEIAGYLCSRDSARIRASTNEGKRFAALASIQWQWSNSGVHKEMKFEIDKYPQELPGPSKDPDKGYFPQLLEMLCSSYDKFENYHATVAMWCMSYCLEPKDMQELCNRVIDKVGCQECPLLHRCDEWNKFIADLKKRRLPSTYRPPST